MPREYKTYFCNNENNSDTNKILINKNIFFSTEQNIENDFHGKYQRRKNNVKMRVQF